MPKMFYDILECVNLEKYTLRIDYNVEILFNNVVYFFINKIAVLNLI